MRNHYEQSMPVRSISAICHLLMWHLLSSNVLRCGIFVKLMWKSNSMWWISAHIYHWNKCKDGISLCGCYTWHAYKKKRDWFYFKFLFLLHPYGTLTISAHESWSCQMSIDMIHRHIHKTLGSIFNVRIQLYSTSVLLCNECVSRYRLFLIEVINSQ